MTFPLDNPKPCIIARLPAPERRLAILDQVAARPRLRTIGWLAEMMYSGNQSALNIDLNALFARGLFIEPKALAAYHHLALSPLGLQSQANRTIPELPREENQPSDATDGRRRRRRNSKKPRSKRNPLPEAAEPDGGRTAATARQAARRARREQRAESGDAVVPTELATASGVDEAEAGGASDVQLDVAARAVLAIGRANLAIGQLLREHFGDGHASRGVWTQHGADGR